MILALWNTTRFGFLTELRYPAMFLSNVVATGLFLSLLLLGGLYCGPKFGPPYPSV